MTISTTTSRISYNGNGATVEFSFPYRFLANADLVVIRVNADTTETTLVLNTDYTVAGAGEDAGGTVTCTTAPVTGSRLVIYRSVAITQEVDYITGDPFPAETHERALDRLTMIAQQIQEEVDRSAKLPVTSTADADSLVADLVRLADSADNIDTVAESIADVNDVADSIDNVDTVAGIAANVTTVAGIAADVAAVENIAANVTTVAGIQANVTTVAGISSAVSNVSSISADVSTVADNIADVQNAEENADAAIAAKDAALLAQAAAESALASTLAAFDSFDDRYLGPKTSDPALDNDGNALVAGALYFNSTIGIMKVYTGSAWVAAYVSSEGLLTAANNLSDVTDAAAARDNLGVEIGADVQAYDANLTSVVNQGLFRKADPTTAAWTKTGAGTATTSSIIYVEVNGVIRTIASGTSITMPTLAAGTDYAIWCKPDGTLEATSNHTSPPVANSRKVGGFHYAPGGNATGTSGGDTTAAINAYSFWDLKFKPNCADPRGMTLVGGGFWSDIYLTGVDAITNGSSKYNVTMADGSSPPKVPTMFGGNGSTTYGSYTWFEAMELGTAFGKRCPTQQEFMSLAYGTTEASSIGSDQGSTILNAAYTSKWGVIQATGVLWVWARDRGGPAAAASWNANTEGRGSEYNAPNSALFGGDWSSGSACGSRCSLWNLAASISGYTVGSRFVCDHLQLD